MTNERAVSGCSCRCCLRGRLSYITGPACAAHQHSIALYVLAGMTAHYLLLLRKRHAEAHSSGECRMAGCPWRCNLHPQKSHCCVLSKVKCGKLVNLFYLPGVAGAEAADQPAGRRTVPPRLCPHLRRQQQPERRARHPVSRRRSRQCIWLPLQHQLWAARRRLPSSRLRHVNGPCAFWYFGRYTGEPPGVRLT